MSEIQQMPDPERVKQTIAKAHRACQEMELAGLELQEVIDQLEQLKSEYVQVGASVKAAEYILSQLGGQTTKRAA